MTSTVNDMADNREARLEWSALPIEEAYPIGSKWTHNSYGSDVFEVVGHDSDGMHLRIRGADGIVNSWIRGALDSFGNPVGVQGVTSLPLTLVTVSGEYNDWPGGFPRELRDGVWYSYVNPEADSYARLIIGPDDSRYSQISDGFYVGSKDAAFGPLHRGWNLPVRYVSPVEPVAAPVEPASTPEASEPTPEPYAPVKGDRVRITELPDGQWGTGPNFKVGEAGTFDSTDLLDPNRRHYVILDNGARGWAKSVARFFPESREELDALMESVRASVVADDLLRAAKREGREEANRTFEEWKREANETAIRYADNNSLCSEFDRCMIEIGMEPRESFERNWDVTVTYTLTVSARSEDDVEEAAMEAIGNGWHTPEVGWEEV